MADVSILRPLDSLKRLLDRRYRGIRINPDPPTILKGGSVEEADVLFCFGGEKQIPWQIISYGSSGPYVHAAICIGNSEVAEATTDGVVRSQLNDLINRYQYIAVARCPGVKGIAALRNNVVTFCQSHIQQKTGYSYVRAALSPLYELVELVILRVYQRPPRFRWPRSRNRTFCSQFVLEAFVAGGYIPKDYYALNARSPTALAEENCFELVGYLTNQQNLELLLSRDIFWTGGG